MLSVRLTFWQLRVKTREEINEMEVFTFLIVSAHTVLLSPCNVVMCLRVSICVLLIMCVVIK